MNLYIWLNIWIALTSSAKSRFSCSLFHPLPPLFLSLYLSTFSLTLPPPLLFESLNFTPCFQTPMLFLDIYLLIVCIHGIMYCGWFCYIFCEELKMLLFCCVNFSGYYIKPACFWPCSAVNYNQTHFCYCSCDILDIILPQSCMGFFHIQIANCRAWIMTFF